MNATSYPLALEAFVLSAGVIGRQFFPFFIFIPMYSTTGKQGRRIVFGEGGVGASCYVIYRKRRISGPNSNFCISGPNSNFFILT